MILVRVIYVTSSVSFFEEPRGKSKVDEETTIQYSLPSKKFELFQIFFLLDDEDQSVEVVEVKEIDFQEVVSRLKYGESVFITHKDMQERNHSPKLVEDAKEPWYFTHI